MECKQANERAEELADIAESLRAIRKNDVDDFTAMTGRYWTGENSRAFLGKVNQAVSKLDENISRIDAAAQTISEIAEQTKAAELAALQLAGKG